MSISTKYPVIAAAGFSIGCMGRFFGGYDLLLQTLIVFMAVDVLSGIASAAVFKSSSKTRTGRLESRAGFQGLIRKGCCLLLVIIGVHLDSLLNTGGFTRDAVLIAFIANELISILENMGKMGVKMPAAIANALEALNKKQ